MSKIICVTNRKLCQDDFLTRIEKIASHKPKTIILREKDLSEDEYETLASEVMAICAKYDVLCTLHNFVDTAVKLKAEAIHMTYAALRTMSADDKGHFKMIGASCHTAEEARKAQIAGCTYIIAGHLFDTLSKKGLQPRGLDFFKEVLEQVTIPVYAIGGIRPVNVSAVMKTGASAACMMSGFMQCEDVDDYFKQFESVHFE